MAPPKSPPLQVLVVEDNAFNQRLLVAFLEEAGHTPVLAANGREALAALERQGFDLILMDVQMPDMNGFQATAAIRTREDSGGSRTPILAITAHADQEDRERCLAAGMDGYIAKPIRYEELIALVERWGFRELEPAARPAEPEVGRRTGLRPELASRFVEDAQSLQIEMRDAIARRDAAALERAAHSLSGTAGLFLAEAVFALARCLEKLAKAEDFGPGTDRACRELEEEIARLARSPRA